MDSNFLAARREPLILDEVQYVPEIFRHLEVVVDRRREPGRFLRTGSQDLSLMGGVAESLAGRCAVLSLPTLALAEVYPEATPAQADAFGSYLATYLERDVRNILSVGSLRDFDRFLRAAAIRAGRLLSFSELARDVGIAPNTARS